MTEPHARIAERDSVITVTIDREAKRNAISPEVTEALWTAVRTLAERDDLRCMVITAVGEYFSAGIDLKAGAGLSSGGQPQVGSSFRRRYRRHHLLYDEFEAIEKPIVLAAQGICLGAGLEMALSCDFRFCTPATQWALPEIGLGVIAGSGGISRLTRLVGPAWAKYMAMAGMPITAEQAKSIGFVHDVFPAEVFEQEVYRFCARLVELPAEAVGVAKLAIDLAADVADRGAQRNIDRIANTTLYGSEEYRSRIARFKKKG